MKKVIATEQPAGLAESAFMWNPLYMKRTVLGPDPSPAGGYHYYGPPPDVGTSYGSWWDPANNLGVIAPVPYDGVTMYSPASGDTLHYEGPATPDALDAVLSYAGEFSLMPATRSGHACLTTASIYGCQVPAIYNPFTGEEITEEYNVMKTQKEASASKKNEKVAAAAAPTVAGHETAPGYKGPASIKTPKLEPTVPSLKSEPNAKMKGLDHSSVDKGKDKMGGGKTGPEGSDDPASSKPMKTVKQSSIKPAGLGSEIKKPDLSSLVKKPVDAMSDDELVEALESHLAQADGHEMGMPGVPKLEIEIEQDPSKLGEGGMLPPHQEGMPMEPAAPAGAGEMPMNPHGQEPVVPVLEEQEDMGMGMGMGMGMPMAHASSDLVRKMRAMASALRAGLSVDPKEQADLERMAIQALRRRKSATANQAEAAGTEEEFVDFIKNRAVDPTTAGIMTALKDLAGVVGALAKKVDKIGVKAEGFGEDPSAVPPMMGMPPAAPPAPGGEGCPAPLPPAPPAPDGSGMLPPPPAPPGSMPQMSEEQKVEDLMSEKPAEGVHFEVLQSLDELEKEGITAAGIDCTLYAEGSVNPFWNLTVNGEPLARIFLQDQERPDEIKAVFCSPMYGEAMAKASEQIEGGLRKCLTDANARFFATAMDRSDLAKRATEIANVEAKKVVAERLASLSDKFLECMATAAIGYDRNFFKGGNPLKSAFADVLQQHGVPLAQAVHIIESSFADGSAPWFQVLAKKANHLMSMEAQAFNDLRGAILEAGVVMPEVEETSGIAEASVDGGKSFTQHLLDNSNQLQATAMTSLSGTDRLDERDQIRRDMRGFRGTRG